MAKPIINDLKVEYRDRFSVGARPYGSVLWNDGKFRYHFWTFFDDVRPSEERQRSTGRRVPRIYKNPIIPGEGRRLETRYLDADSATWRPVVAEIVKRLADEGMVEKAKQAKLDEIAAEEAEQEAAILAKKKSDLFGTHGERLRGALGRSLAAMLAASNDETRGQESQTYWFNQYRAALALCDECDGLVAMKD